MSGWKAPGGGDRCRTVAHRRHRVALRGQQELEQVAAVVIVVGHEDPQARRFNGLAALRLLGVLARFFPGITIVEIAKKFVVMPFAQAHFVRTDRARRLGIAGTLALSRRCDRAKVVRDRARLPLSADRQHNIGVSLDGQCGTRQHRLRADRDGSLNTVVNC